MYTYTHGMTIRVRHKTVIAITITIYNKDNNNE